MKRISIASGGPSPPRRIAPMLDTLFLLAGLGFFGLATLYARACSALLGE